MMTVLFVAALVATVALFIYGVYGAARAIAQIETEESE